MKENYLTKDNISEKSDEWMDNLYIPSSRKKKFKFIPKDSALLVVDMQEYFINEDSHAFLPAAKAIIPNINKIIDEYRRLAFPIIFTYHAYSKDEKTGIMGRWWSDLPKTTDPLSKIHAGFNLKKEDIIIRKNRYSAFIDTNLDNILKEKNVVSLVITGIMTHLCCESTARDAFMKDYEVYFVIDATATETENLHLSSLKTLTDGFVIPLKTDTILKEIKPLA